MTIDKLEDVSSHLLMRVENTGTPEQGITPELATRELDRRGRSMAETEADIRAYNTRTIWADVANHLRVAQEAASYAQDTLEELDVPHITENLTPHIEALGRFQLLAEEKSVA